MSKAQVVKISTHRKVLKAHVFNIFHSLLTTSCTKRIYTQMYKTSILGGVCKKVRKKKYEREMGAGWNNFYQWEILPTWREKHGTTSTKSTIMKISHKVFSILCIKLESTTNDFDQD